MMRSNDITFAKKEPSLFVLQSPFQILCAAAAIKYFEITEYEILLVLPIGEVRNQQSINMMEKLDLHYKIVSGSRVGNRNRLTLPFTIEGKYRRAFLGYYAFEDGYYHCIKQLRRGGSLVLLDDGIATITLVLKGFTPHGRERYVYGYYYWLMRIRGISAHNLFTVYKGLENPIWHIEINDLSLVNKKKDAGSVQGIYFVGTNSSSYSSLSLKHGEEEYKEMIYASLKDIRAKYPDEVIIYIPHGRDKAEYTISYCEEYGIRYQKVSTSIEMFMLEQLHRPKAIYGYTSSALFNLKKLFPETEVINILPEGNDGRINERFKEISDYYETQGIITHIYKKQNSQ